MRSYAIATDPNDCGRRFWFWCFVYETQPELARAAKRYSRGEDIDWENTAGCFHPKLSYNVSRKGKISPSNTTPYIGTMRLCEEYLTREVLIHEASHAALNLVRSMVLDVAPDLLQIENEEALCFATQHISEALIGALL